MEFYNQIVQLTLGVCFFMYGMMLTSDNLQKVAADRVRDLMGRIAQNRLLGILGGLGLTAILQSSSAVTVLLVGLATAGVVTIRQVMSVIIGTAIGTTVTVQLISFSITAYAVYFVIGGFVVVFMSKKKTTRYIGGVIFGFGLIFYGLLEMGQAVAIIKNEPFLKQSFEYLSAHPYITLIVTTFFTAAVHSSAVTIGLAMTLAESRLITMNDALWWVYGANVGTTATALLASMSGNYLGRQVAWAHFYYKVLSAIPFFFFTDYFVKLLDMTGGPLNRQIANGHTILNIIAAIIFFPFINQGARFIEKMFPRPSSEKEFSAKYLDQAALGTPSLAFAHAQRELLRMADYVVDMVRRSINVFDKCNDEMIEEVRAIDNKVDILNQQIKTYLVQLTAESLSPQQSQKVVTLITLVSDLENIGDVIDKNILMAALKKNKLKVSFSQEGWEEIKEFHRLVVQNCEMAVSAFTLSDKALSEKVIENKRRLRDLEQDLRENHIDRLHRGLRETMSTSSIHLDVLSHYRRVVGYAANFAYHVLREASGDQSFKKKDSDQELPRKTENE